jgi:dipeptide/tripeptide permease
VLTHGHIGAFDIISEFFPHIAIILYRVYPERHRFLSQVFLISCITTATGTLCETIITMWLFGSLWSDWQIGFKVSTPLLHIAFSAAQIHGSLVFWRMYQRQKNYMKEKKVAEDLEIQQVLPTSDYK